MSRSASKPLVLDIAALRHVLGGLKATKAGSRVMDYHLAIACGLISERGLEIIEKGHEARPMELMAVDEAVPMLTTSLDAGLPGENIVSVTREDGGWLATADCVPLKGSHFTASARAHTEVLARRCATVEGILIVHARKRTPLENPRIRALVTTPVDSSAQP